MKSIDPRRLRRALALQVEELEPGTTYHVTGGRVPHVVRHTARGWTCDCMDQLYAAERACKHRLAVYLERRLTPQIRTVLLKAIEQAQRTPGPRAASRKSTRDSALGPPAGPTVEPTMEQEPARDG